MSKLINRSFLASAVSLLFVGYTHAANINGAWTSDVSACAKIFENKNGRISMTRNSDFFGGGFIIEGRELRGKVGTCHVKTRKDDGPTVQSLAECSTDIAISTNQFSLRMDGDNKLTRFFAGMPEMEMTYFRCPQ